MKQIPKVSIVMTLLLVAATGLMAQDNSPSVADLVKGINTVWVLIAAFLVFFMQAGFGMLEAGFTRAKNAANILMKNMMDFAMASLAYWIIGFALMYGIGNGFFGGSYFFLGGLPEDMNGIPSLAFWFFQVVFVAAAATIVAGAMAERTKFKSYLIYSFLISALVYPIVGHWIWGGGWLSKLGFMDFAGSTVVHAVGGWASFIGAIIIGPRLGKYNPDGSVNAIQGHNLPLAALGCLILWFGWFGFNPGSSLSGMDAALICKSRGQHKPRRSNRLRDNHHLCLDALRQTGPEYGDQRCPGRAGGNHRSLRLGFDLGQRGNRVPGKFRGCIRSQGS